jgi:hypothetical protein
MNFINFRIYLCSLPFVYCWLLPSVVIRVLKAGLCGAEVNVHSAPQPGIILTILTILTDAVWGQDLSTAEMFIC